MWLPVPVVHNIINIYLCIVRNLLFVLATIAFTEKETKVNFDSFFIYLD